MCGLLVCLFRSLLVHNAFKNLCFGIFYFPDASCKKPLYLYSLITPVRNVNHLVLVYFLCLQSMLTLQLGLFQQLHFGVIYKNKTPNSK